MDDSCVSSAYAQSIYKIELCSMDEKHHYEIGLPEEQNRQADISGFVSSLMQIKLLIFDWDGTAVDARSDRSWELISSIENLLRGGVICCVMTGTSIRNLLDPFLLYLSPEAKKKLYVFANRGSEVFEFDDLGDQKLVYRYEPSVEEQRKLSEISLELLGYFEGLGLKVELIQDRLNRIKFDLIAEDPWRSPRKDQISELLSAVQIKIKAAGTSKGLRSLMNQAKQVAHRSGLGSVRFTTDAKHIEVGFTSKQDSMDWILKNIVSLHKIMPEEILVLGDEFGTLDSTPGSDALMRVPQLRSSVFVSVGKEPEGVPVGVQHLGGGARTFIRLIKEMNLKQRFAVCFLEGNSDQRCCSLMSWGWSHQDSLWRLVQSDFDASCENEFETLFTQGNGYLGIRGSTSIPIPSSRGDLFLAGVYDRRLMRRFGPEPPDLLNKLKDDTDEFSEIVVFPSLFYFRLKINGQQFLPGKWNGGHFYKRSLCLNTGILSETYDVPLGLPGHSLKIQTQRIVSSYHRHLLIQEIEFRAIGTEVSLDIDTSFEDPDRELKHPHLKVLNMETGEALGEEEVKFTELHEFESSSSHVRCVFLAKSWNQGCLLSAPQVNLLLKPGCPQVLQRLILVYHSQETHDPKLHALRDMNSLQIQELPQYLVDHLQVWQKSWSNFDVDLSAKPLWKRSFRFNAYHLRISSSTDPHTSIGARTLSGSAYDGHIFWDTEVFILPFFNHSDPKVVRSCLQYRYFSLHQAKLRAKSMGCEGACFAWESALTGRDVTPSFVSIAGQKVVIPVFTGSEQIHITADVAYAVWSYWLCTQDWDWIIQYGIEILVETARFWVTRSQKINQEFHILKVVGPDEYHHDVDDNAYTNWMARVNLEKTCEILQMLKEVDQKSWIRITQRLKIHANEFSSWKEIFQKIYFPKPNEQGVIEEFQGFFKLKRLVSLGGDPLRAPLERFVQWQEINESMVVKQADVLMIPFLFPDALSQEIVRANYNFYEPLTDHGSSLSLSVHAAVAAQIERWDHVESYWDHSLNLDLSNLMKNTSLGIHAGCMGGTWQALFFHILGIRLGQRELYLSKKHRKLPHLWSGIQAKILYQGQIYQVQVSSEGYVSLCKTKSTNKSC